MFRRRGKNVNGAGGPLLIRLYRTFYLSCLLLGMFLTVIDGVQAANPAGVRRADLAGQEKGISAQTGPPSVLVLTFRGAVTPVLRQYLSGAIEEAQLEGAEAVVLRLDTPGGSVEVTKQIVQDMLASPVPVVVYVAPSAAQAGSAGTFITLAGHVAAMAPGSSIGAASPVGGQGEDIGDTMEAKVVNILSADIENLAARRGEDAVEWAVAAVQEAAAATDTRALELGVIDFIATNVPDLLDQMDGFVVTVLGEERTLRTEDALIMPRELSPLQEFLNFISNPSVATILLTLGSIGLIAEIYNPGTFIPGMIGLISLLLGLYSLGQLEANFAGLALIGLGADPAGGRGIHAGVWRARLGRYGRVHFWQRVAFRRAGVGCAVGDDHLAGGGDGRVRPVCGRQGCGGPTAGYGHRQRRCDWLVGYRAGSLCGERAGQGSAGGRAMERAVAQRILR